MFTREDNTYQDMIEKSTLQWLDEAIEGDDIVNRHGAKLTKEYVESLKQKIAELEEKNKMKDEFLRKLKMKLSEQR